METTPLLLNIGKTGLPLTVYDDGPATGMLFNPLLKL